MLAGDLLGERARLTPRSTALVWVPTGERLTYAELDACAVRLARVWREALGLAKGDRLALLADNRVGERGIAGGISEGASAMTSSILAHRVTGKADGPPLLLLNGGLMSMAAWERIAVPLEDAYRVVRCDLRGQILSPGEPEPRLEAHVADLIALLDSLGIERVHAAGTSFGGLVALRLAALHPARTASVIAITATERITPEYWKASAEVRDAALAAAAGGDGGRVLDLVLPATYSPGYLEANAGLLAAHRHQTSLLPPIWFRGVAAIISSLEGLDLRPELPKIRCPALIVAGEEDRMFPLEHARALAAGIHGARLEIVPGGSHGLVIEQPEQVVEILRGFLASL